MTLVNESELIQFLDSASLEQARRAEAALTAMAASARLRVVQLETRSRAQDLPVTEEPRR